MSSLMARTSWQAVAALVDPVRRSLYEHVRAQGHPVTREQAGDSIGISRTLTAFHLDKLVEAGLLRARYEAPADRPRGRGRAPKVYEPVDEGLSVTVPARQYELIGEILADAVAGRPADAGAAATGRAVETGRELASASGLATGPGSEVGTQLAAAYALLLDLGFEPVTEEHRIALRNCPFRRLAQRQAALVCGLNVSFVGGLLDGLGADRLRAELRPQPGHCCVQVTT